MSEENKKKVTELLSFLFTEIRIYDGIMSTKSCPKPLNPQSIWAYVQ
jgi:hypothetical protein